MVRERERKRGDLKHLSVHQWIRSAIPDSQHPTSPVGFLFLKLPPPPCAVLLESLAMNGTSNFWQCPVHNMAMWIRHLLKGTADETDEVDLQVLCLTGEGVTLSVPCSMLGYELRRLVSEKLPCKPGAKLAVHHVNTKLTLNQTLAEQGIVGKSAMLSCTYIPTNVYTAWCYVCGLPTSEREVAAGRCYATWGSDRWRVFTLSSPQPCKIDFWWKIQPKPGAGDLAIWAFKAWVLVRISTKAWSWWPCHRAFKAWVLFWKFNQCLERVTLPSSLQSLSFGNVDFNQNLEQVTLPSSLQSLSFGFMIFTNAWSGRPCHRVFKAGVLAVNVNQSLERVTLPSSLQSLSFDGWFQPKPGAGDLAIEPSKFEFWWEFQPKPGAGEPCRRAFKVWVLAMISFKAWSGWPCHRVFKAWVFGMEFQPKPGAGDLAIEPSKLEFCQSTFNQSLGARWSCHRVFRAWVLRLWFQRKPGASDLAVKPSELDLWLEIQPKPGAGDLAIESSKLEFWPRF